MAHRRLARGRRERITRSGDGLLRRGRDRGRPHRTHTDRPRRPGATGARGVGRTVSSCAGPDCASRHRWALPEPRREARTPLYGELQVRLTSVPESANTSARSARRLKTRPPRGSAVSITVRLAATDRSRAWGDFRRGRERRPLRPPENGTVIVRVRTSPSDVPGRPLPSRAGRQLTPLCRDEFVCRPHRMTTVWFAAVGLHPGPRGFLVRGVGQVLRTCSQQHLHTVTHGPNA